MHCHLVLAHGTEGSGPDDYGLLSRVRRTAFPGQSKTGLVRLLSFRMEGKRPGNLLSTLLASAWSQGMPPSRDSTGSRVSDLPSFISPLNRPLPSRLLSALRTLAGINHQQNRRPRAGAREGS